MLRVHTKKYYSAISLIEILVVIAVLGILAAFVAPNVGGWNCRQEVRNDFERVNDFMQTARAEAVNRNRTMKVVFNSRGRILMAFEGNKPNASQSCNGSRFTWLGHPRKQEILDYHVKTGITNYPRSICFKSDGSATSASYIIGKQCNGKTRQYKAQIFGATGFIEKLKFNLTSNKWDEL